VDDEQFLDVEAEAGERRRRQGRRRVEHHHQPAGPLRRDQRRREHADLADAGVGQQQLRQGAARPAAAGKLGVETGEAARHGIAADAAELMAEPERRVQGFGRAPDLVTRSRSRLASERTRGEVALGAWQRQALQRRHRGRYGIHELN